MHSNDRLNDHDWKNLTLFLCLSGTFGLRKREFEIDQMCARV
jgi:hypothetical protein